MKKNLFDFMGLFPICAILMFTASCKDKIAENNTNDSTITEIEMKNPQPFFKLSLAQWSLHRFVQEENGSPFLFAEQAKNMGFEGLEYVSGLYTKEIEKLGMDAVVDSLLDTSKAEDITNVLIMVDGEGELANPDEKGRNKAVENHKKWVDAAQKLGCHSIRVNLFGANDAKTWKTAATDGLSKLTAYASEKNINVLVENHGYLSSNAALLAEVMKAVNRDNCGTLPDFGNFCLKREDGELWGAKCVEEYDKYQGVKELMPFAKAVSAKSYEFDENGNETTIDYAKMMQLVKDAGYTGFVGVEYEGEELSEKEGIAATKDLLISVSEKLK